MIRIGYIIAVCVSLGSVSHATNAQLLQRDFSTQPRELVICAFEPGVMGHDLATRQFDLVDWKGYLDRNITILELSRLRTATHVPTALGPISNELPMSAQERERTARGYGCAVNEDSVLLFDKDGTEQARWPEAVKKDQLFRVIDGVVARRFDTNAGEQLQ